LLVAGQSPFSQIKLYHRVARDSETPAPFTVRGILTTDALIQDGVIKDLELAPNDVYQLAIERPGLEGSLWPKVGVPACRFTKNAVEIISILAHIDSEEVIHISHYTSAPIEACSDPSVGGVIRLSDPETVTVNFRKPDRPDPPRLHQPPVVKFSDDGSEIKPPPEKTFIQKYWFYAIPIVFMIMTAGGGEEPTRR